MDNNVGIEILMFAALLAICLLIGWDLGRVYGRQQVATGEYTCEVIGNGDTHCYPTEEGGKS